MHTAKKIIYFVMMLALASLACADRIYIFNFHYEDGAITLIDKKVDFGNVPDRLVQPEYGYRAELVDMDGNKIESFRFAAPNEIFVDYSDEGKLYGGMIVLNSTDFSFVTPYYPELDEINFYNKRNHKVSNVVVEDEQLAPVGFAAYFYVGLVVLIIIFIYFVWKKRESS